MDMERDPCNIPFKRGQFVSDYIGFEQGWFVLKVKTDGHMGGVMYRREIFNWIFDNIKDHEGFMMQSNSPDPIYPRLMLCESDGSSIYVLLKNFNDLMAFDETFRIEGVMKLLQEAA